MKDKLVTSEYVPKNILEKKTEVYPLKFKSSDGWYPLIAIPISYRGDLNPYFKNNFSTRVSCRISNRMDLAGTGIPTKYQTTRHHGGPIVNLYTGFFSAIATRTEFDYMPSSMLGDNIDYQMRADVDVFCLGVVKVSKLPEVKWLSNQKVRRYVYPRNVMQITYEMKDVKILISKEKLRKSLFMKHYYTATVRSNILKQITLNRKNFPLTTEDVSDDYLDGFVIRPHTVRTNSLGKVVTMSNEIKNSVFTNLNAEVV
jgi:hypothetical protein